jgi:hypothetical protein
VPRTQFALHHLETGLGKALCWPKGLEHAVDVLIDESEDDNVG